VSYEGKMREMEEQICELFKWIEGREAQGLWTEKDQETLSMLMFTIGIGYGGEIE
jgi:hypothetical protein